MARATVCVFGGAGFLGKHIVETLVIDGFNVRVFDIVPQDQFVAPSTRPGITVEYIQSDILNYGAVLSAVDGCETVIHTASVIDLYPMLTVKAAKVNVLGTRTIINACKRSETVKHLIYTSTMDVCFNGEDVIDGSDDLPYSKLGDGYSSYIYTKVLAEKLVLAANSESLACVSLRPAHIFGPGDIMITEMIDALESGPMVRFGDGHMDFVYVRNCAQAHTDCVMALHKQGTDGIAGEAFALSDFHEQAWDHCEPFMAAAGISVPSVRVPVFLIYLVCKIIDALSNLLYWITRVPMAPLFNSFVVMIFTHSFYFSGKKARAVFRKPAPVSRERAMQETIEWVENNYPRPSENTSQATHPALSSLHQLHLVYGLVMLVFGSLAFVCPHFLAKILYVAVPDSPASMMTQLLGVVTFVLGVYSVVASVFKWPIDFFRASWFPKLAVAAFYIALVWIEQLPTSFLLYAVLDGFVGFATLGLVLAMGCSSLPKLPWAFTSLTVSQMSHTIASGSFAFIMMLMPQLVLPQVLGKDAQGAEISDEAGYWGRSMGASEFMMTWIYAASGLLTSLIGFAWLSVVTRIGVTVVLFATWYIGHTPLVFFWGVLPDFFLGAWTLFVLRGRAVDPKAYL
eukprot:m.7102 g.7102  ORF g.7102 m.7102 type:complete len:626 (-) comp5217_c0_seq2:3675-5552(-)